MIDLPAGIDSFGIFGSKRSRSLDIGGVMQSCLAVAVAIKKFSFSKMF
jgi:hypothetical protein